MSAYEAPKYVSQPGTLWFHTMYGHIPGHQMDFIYRPRTPHDRLKPTHFGELQLAIRHFQPAPGRVRAFAIYNLSANDTQHRPGHGGLAILLGIRSSDMTDQAGRVAPIFAHAIMLVDQPIDYHFLNETTEKFIDTFQAHGSSWYQRYYERGDLESDNLQSQYVQHFATLPRPDSPSSELRWKLAGKQPKSNRFVIRHPPTTSLARIVECANRFASILYYSKVRWLSISNAQEQLAQGLYQPDSQDLLIRFESDAIAAADDGRSYDLPIDKVPVEPVKLADLMGLIPQARANPRPDPQRNKSTSVTERVDEGPTSSSLDLQATSTLSMPAVDVSTNHTAIGTDGEATFTSGLEASRLSAGAESSRKQAVRATEEQTRGRDQVPSLPDNASDPPVAPQSNRPKLFAIGTMTLAVSLLVVSYYRLQPAPQADIKIQEVIPAMPKSSLATSGGKGMHEVGKKRPSHDLPAKVGASKKIKDADGTGAAVSGTALHKSKEQPKNEGDELVSLATRADAWAKSCKELTCQQPQSKRCKDVTDDLETLDMLINETRKRKPDVETLSNSIQDQVKLIQGDGEPKCTHFLVN